MSVAPAPNVNERGVLRVSNFNNSSVLVGNKHHTLIVSGDNAVEARKYAHTLGTTSLHEALSVLVNKKSSKEENEKALGDIILLRLILSGKIQFKERKFFGLVNTAITKSFKPLPTDPDDRKKMNMIIENLVDQLDSGENDISVFRHFLKKIIGVFGISAIIACFPLYFGAVLTYDGPEIYNARKYLVDHGYNGAETMGIEQLSQSTWLTVPGYEPYRKALEGITLKAISSNGVPLMPIIIGLLAAANYTKQLVDWQDNIISKGIVLLIDNFISTNQTLLRLLLENADGESLVPTPLKGDPVGMALFFQYIKQLKGANIKPETEEEREIREMNRNDRKLGVTRTDMNSFIQSGEPECSICGTNLSDASEYGKAVTACKNKHKFHKDCISKWIERNPTCPVCREHVVSPLRGGKGTRRRNHRRNLYRRRTRSRRS